jgi:multidrug resistance efflux pump
MQTLQATGTTEPSSAATVSFAVSGTVATVPVAVGDKVTAGQVLATLDTASLNYALATAQEQVANAELTLTQAQSGQVSAASGAGSSAAAASSKTSAAGTGTTGAGTSGAGTTGTASTKTGATSGGSAGAGSTGAANSPGASHTGSGSAASITAAQKLLLATVRQADSLLARTKTDLALATTLCSSQNNPLPPPTGKTPAPTPTPTPTPTTTPSTAPTTAPTTATTPSQTLTPAPAPTGGRTATAPAALTTLTTMQNVSLTTASTGQPTTCIQGQQAVLKGESQLLALQQGLSGQETALDKLLTSSASSTGTAGTGTTSTGTTGAGTPAAAKVPTGTASAGTASTGKTSGGTGSTTVAVSAAQLAADQSAVDAANASLALAQQQLSQASIVSPLTGVVSSVGLTVGQQATAGSTTTAVDVIDPTGHGVTLSVDVTKIPQVKVGDKATVVPDGSTTPLAATVSYVAAAPTSSSSTAYNVQLAFTSNPTKLRDGVQAAVTITTAQAVNALAVPTSAVNHRGAINYVLVLNGSTTKAQLITVGSVGAIYTQVVQGLTAGQRVVLANPNTPIPTSSVTGRIARITGGVTSGTAGVLGGSSATTGVRPGG